MMSITANHAEPLRAANVLLAKLIPGDWVADNTYARKKLLPSLAHFTHQHHHEVENNYPALPINQLNSTKTCQKWTAKMFRAVQSFLTLNDSSMLSLELP